MGVSVVDARLRRMSVRSRKVAHPTVRERGESATYRRVRPYVAAFRLAPLICVNSSASFDVKCDKMPQGCCMRES
jgi:hypothetical protein